LADLTSNGEVLSAEDVERLHRNADTDTRKESLHHTLGPRGNQASPGDHDHKGGNSNLLFAGMTITGDRSDGTALLSVIQILTQFGATDSSTA
jgi:hypothetical protein